MLFMIKIMTSETQEIVQLNGERQIWSLTVFLRPRTSLTGDSIGGSQDSSTHKSRADVVTTCERAPGVDLNRFGGIIDYTSCEPVLEIKSLRKGRSEPKEGGSYSWYDEGQGVIFHHPRPRAQQASEGVSLAT